MSRYPDIQMKLCRFDLLSSPGPPKSGVVYAGKVYETDGTDPVAIFDVAETRLLSPIGHPPSVRLFESLPGEGDWVALSEGRSAAKDLSFTYLNPACIVGPMTELMPCGISEDLSFKVCIGAVIAEPGLRIPSEQADPYILGFTLVTVFYAADVDRIERMRGNPIGRSHDVGIAVGPAITTPDELENALVQDLAGRRYAIPITASVDGDEVARFNAEELEITFAEAVAFASDSCPVVAGDLIVLSIGAPQLEQPLISGSEVRLTSDWLGTLANRIPETH